LEQGGKLSAKEQAEKIKRVAEPIVRNKDISRIRSILSDKPRDLLLFDLAVETGIGMKKLLSLKVRDLKGMRKGESINIGSNRNKNLVLSVTDSIYQTFHNYLKELDPKPNDYLFKSKKGQQPLNLSSVSNMINGWYEAAGIKNCYGAISLRKTWEYNSKDKIQPGDNNTLSILKPIFKPIETPSAQQTIFKELFAAIVSGKIVPGARLTTAEISKAFKVSQAPVRVALNWLEARGFITSQKKSGSIVKELTIEELHEIINIRMILETSAAKLAYKACTEETLDLLASIIERYKGVDNFEEADPLNRLFHQTLYRDAGMPLLTTMITDLYDRFSPYAILTYKDSTYPPENTSGKNRPEYYHIKILEAMRRKDLTDILKYITKKIGRARLITEAVLKQRERLGPAGNHLLKR
jgi:DNA-binding GntR family transcriptional regulator